MPLKTLGLMGPRAVKERVNNALKLNNAMKLLYLQAGSAERLLQLGVGEALTTGVQVEPQAPREQGRLLGYDCQAGAQILQGSRLLHHFDGFQK